MTFSATSARRFVSKALYVTPIAPRPSSHSEPSARRVMTKCSNLSVSPIDLNRSQALRISQLTGVCRYKVDRNQAPLDPEKFGEDDPKLVYIPSGQTPDKTCSKQARRPFDRKSIPAGGIQNCCQIRPY